MIENEQEFRDWCNKCGLRESTIKNYISWLNMASRRINEDVTPNSLSSEDDVVRMISLLSNHPDMLEVHKNRPRDTKAAMRMYVRMGSANSDSIEMLRPQLKPNLMDLLIDAGLDVSSWSNFRGGPDRAASNPKYCYRWSFCEPAKMVVLSIWFEDLKIEDDIIYQDRNIRRIAQDLSGPSKRRALDMDHDIQVAWETKTPIRVVICDRNTDMPSRITRRMLDPSPWGLRFYDVETGQCRLERGYIREGFVDQFIIQENHNQEVKRRDRTVTEFARSPEIRSRALERARGKCEYCGIDGFRMADGQIYLESHHVIPLSVGGPDNVNNIAALCPNHHKEAHHGIDKEKIKSALQQKLAAT